MTWSRYKFSVFQREVERRGRVGTTLSPFPAQQPLLVSSSKEPVTSSDAIG